MRPLSTHIRMLFCPASHLMAVLVFLLLSDLVLCSSAPACQADSILNLFEASLQDGQVARVTYRKDAQSVLFGKRATENGTLWLGPPKRYRIESQSQVIVRGSDTLWTYTPETKQVTIRTGNLDSLEFGPAGFFGSLRNDFFPVDCADDTVDGRVLWRVRLAARSETAAIQRLSLWIDQSTHRAQTAEYVDYNEENARLTFSGFQVEKDGAEERFSFLYPKGVERIVLPQTTQGKKKGMGDNQ